MCLDEVIGGLRGGGGGEVSAVVGGGGGRWASGEIWLVLAGTPGSALGERSPTRSRNGSQRDTRVRGAARTHRGGRAGGGLGVRSN